MRNVHCAHELEAYIANFRFGSLNGINDGKITF
ncbi:hypothetical protein swp_3427 [Shewanella piezotolerans WP3]|uniref:Uncharacterized protein n=1 Tax=Shewanella piezotolerans (strain WP3 / JCM 13877) TaxID=225849 RepID=B8CRW8_SHEPW|nr:hypothetical protein swp_3427 [Shewanella piezotolerans WP3]